MRGVVETLVAGHLALERGQAAALGLAQLGEQPPALLNQFQRRLVERGTLARDPGIDVDHGKTRIQEAGRQRARKRLLQIEGHIGRERVVRAALRFQFHRGDRSDRRNLAGEGQVQRASRLHVGLAAEMHFLMAQESAEDRELVDVTLEIREQPLGQVQAVAMPGDIQIRRRACVFLEVPRFQMADGAVDFVEKDVPRIAAGRDLRSGGHLPWQKALDRCGGEAQASQAQGIPSRSERFAYGCHRHSLPRLL